MKSTVRLLATVTATALLALALLASLPSGATAGDKDCKDFRSQRAAQFFFLRHGGPRYDPHRLDGDNDGVACEDNPCPCYYKKRLPRHARHDDGLRPARLASGAGATKTRGGLINCGQWSSPSESGQGFSSTLTAPSRFCWNIS